MTKCILFKGCLDRNGYGKVCRKTPFGKAFLVHRWAWLTQVGEISRKMTIDHVCKNRSCYNIEHLEVVTLKENILRGNTIQARNKAKTHCIHGHEFTTENTYIDKKRKSRKCKACAKSRINN